MMLRQLLPQPATVLYAVTVNPAMRRATFVTTAQFRAEGDTGAQRSTGGAGDAYQRRERASEDMAIRKREREKLLELKRRIVEQQGHLTQLSEHIDVITKDSQDQTDHKDQKDQKDQD